MAIPRLCQVARSALYINIKSWTDQTGIPTSSKHALSLSRFFPFTDNPHRISTGLSLQPHQFPSQSYDLHAVIDTFTETTRQKATAIQTSRKMRLKPLVALLFLAGDLVTATPISCSEVCSLSAFFRRCPTRANHQLQFKRDLILKGELPPEACCSYGRCLGDVVVAMF